MTDEAHHPQTTNEGGGVSGEVTSPASWYMITYSNAWFQVVLISFICFCCPGVIAIASLLLRDVHCAQWTGWLGTSGRNRCSKLERCPPLCDCRYRVVFSWSHFLHYRPAGVLALGRMDIWPLQFRNNGGFVIAAGAILGIGASFLWVAQGAIMTSYVSESQKGRAIAVFWIIFNLGGMIGSLVSFGLNFHSKSGTVSNSTHIAIMVIMFFGWAIGVFICPPTRIRLAQLKMAEEEVVHQPFFDKIRTIAKTLFTFKIVCILPLFFCANVFYSYQQNNVNGTTFNIRYGFQKWEDKRLAQGLKQDIDYAMDADIAVGPIFLYFFYGAYDALWQSFCYWLIGTMSNSAAITAVLVGAYKTFQAAGGAMAWRINALHKPPMTQFAMDWGLCIDALVLAVSTLWSVTLTSVGHEAGGETDMKREVEGTGNIAGK
ncbi:conserved hypothetical protein [Coccidioides posadasii str. Silveira]|uniref:Uncharacterized protein n=1 Tax=Coccidioides posadasii (strain RMSCC 757 / Silveira) TaxID=443226 RepID=E9DG77_COCPS|nr:conserved hypothetical protein [Coccidioides posadasii str. Silveira]